jgi:RNA polymerase sigma factor (TIGR02999 family)
MRSLSTKDVFRAQTPPRLPRFRQNPTLWRWIQWLGVERDPITRLLEEWRNGDDAAIQEVMPLVYDELRRSARFHLRSQRPGQTIDRPTVLVHEFYLRTAALRHVDWRSRGQFIATAAKVMRNLLIDHARKRNAAKRGGVSEVPVYAVLTFREPDLDVLEVHRALEKLSAEFPRHAEVVELMFFGGLNAGEASDVMSACGTAVSKRTVERDWRFARAWLSREVRV